MIIYYIRVEHSKVKVTDYLLLKNSIFVIMYNSIMAHSL